MTLTYEPMKMTGLINITQEMSTSGAALKKDAGKHGSYDAKATSTECIESFQSSRRGLRFKLSDTSGSSNAPCFDIGLVSAAACPQHRDSVQYKSLTYAAYINVEEFTVWESGSQLGEFRRVKAGDTIDIRLTSEDLPKIEYCVNGVVRYTSKETSKQAPLFVKVCASNHTPLVEDLQWIIRKDPQIAKLQTSIVELETQITQQQTQLQTSEGEKHRLKAAAEEKEAEIEALQAVVEQQKKEMKVGSEERHAVVKENTELQAVIEALQADIAQYQMEIKAGSDALLSVTREKADLLLQTEDQREAARIASDTKVHLQEENDTLRTAIASLEEQLWMKEAASRAAVERENELQAQLVKHEENTTNIWNLLAFILALISALALNHLVGIVRGN